MSEKLMFSNPQDAIQFIATCLQQDDSSKLWDAFNIPPAEFWKERLLQSLCEIQDTETLERVFLESESNPPFMLKENMLHLGGHDWRTHCIHIYLIKENDGWILGSINVCR
jgi:hypothetical protein